MHPFKRGGGGVQQSDAAKERDNTRGALCDTIGTIKLGRE